MDALIWFGVVLVGVIPGALVGRWWALLLVFLVPVVLIPAGANEDAMPYWQIGTFAFAPFVLIGLAVGVALRKMAALDSDGNVA